MVGGSRVKGCPCVRITNDGLLQNFKDKLAKEGGKNAVGKLSTSPFFSESTRWCFTTTLKLNILSHKLTWLSDIEQKLAFVIALGTVG